MESGLELELEGLLNCESSPGPPSCEILSPGIFACPVSDLNAGTLPHPRCCWCLASSAQQVLHSLLLATLSLEENLVSPSY